MDYGGSGSGVKRVRASMEGATANMFYDFDSNNDISNLVWATPVAGTSWTYELPERGILFEDMSRNLVGATGKERRFLDPCAANLLLYNAGIERMRDYMRTNPRKELDSGFKWKDDVLTYMWQLAGVNKTPPPPGDTSGSRHLPRRLNRLLKGDGPLVNYWDDETCGGKFLHFGVVYQSIGLNNDEIFFNTAMGSAIPKSSSNDITAASRPYAFVPQIVAITSHTPTLSLADKAYTGADGETHYAQNCASAGRCIENYDYTVKVTAPPAHHEIRDMAMICSREKLDATYRVLF
jgi:hypothetical protein